MNFDIIITDENNMCVTNNKKKSEKCACILGQNLKDVTIINLAAIQNEDIDKYDLIIIGSPIRMGMIDKRINNFISKNAKLLKNKKVAYFICCGFNENINKLLVL